MRKSIAVLLIVCALLTVIGCSKPKDIRFSDGSTRTVPPYGLINELSKDGKQDMDVVYKISVGDVVLSVIFCETIIIPIISLGYNLWEPVEAVKK